MSNVADPAAAFNPASRRLEQIVVNVVDDTESAGWDDAPSESEEREPSEKASSREENEEHIEGGAGTAEPEAQAEPAAELRVVDFEAEIQKALLEQREEELARQEEDRIARETEALAAAVREFQDTVRRLFDVEI
jgi:hypothetical protein